MPRLTPATLSELIGAIHDCALDADLWPQAMARVCRAFDFVASQLYVVDFDTGAHSFARGWGEKPEATRELRERFGAESAAMQRAVLLRPDDAKPFVMRRDAPPGFLDSPFYRAWALPLGYCDMVSTVVLRDGWRVGQWGVARHLRAGPAGPREIEAMRLLAPHARRAVTIADLLETRTVVAEALADTLDRLTLGVSILGEGGRILHANAAARQMMADGQPIRSEGGRLAAARPEETAALRGAVELAGRDEAALGATGLGLKLTGREGETTLAHVLPLARRAARQRLVPRATAAVFVARRDRAAAPRLDGFARAFGLSPAEARLLARLVSGETPAEAALALGITLATAKTHLAHLLAKTETARQADLRALVARLCPPVAGMAG
jgi:DNA-binding CsgD family transcriptional regulator